MLTINKKEDIIIPFNNIGDPQWETNTRLILEAIAKRWNERMKKPISLQEISKLETRLGTSLPENLKLFYQTFGTANIGEQLQELNEIEWLKNILYNELRISRDFAEKEKEVLPYLVTFSNYLGNGNMFCFHCDTKEIYYFGHDGVPYIFKMLKTVDEYIQGCLIFAQSDLFGENINQEQAHTWTEELISQIFGKEVSEKWRF